MRVELLARDPGAAVHDPDHQPLSDDPRAHRDGVAARVARRVLEQVRERALELGGVGADQRQLGIDREGETRAARVERASPPRAGSRRPSTTRGAARRRPACRRDRSSSFSTSAVSRSASSTIARPSSSRSARESSPSTSAVAGGEDRGQRGAQVVRDAAQQRGLELVAAAQRLRLDHLGLQPVALQRGRQQRLQRRNDAGFEALARARGHTGSDHERSDQLSVTAQREREPLVGTSGRAELDPRPFEPERLRQPRARRPRVSPRRRAPPSRVRARSAERSASRRRCSASLARERASSATALATTAATRKIASATQFWPSAIVKRPVGGRWKKLNAAALAMLVADPSRSPHTVETSSTASR